MTSRSVLFLLPIGLSLLLSACSGNFHTASWKSPGVDFKKYSSYAWVAPGDTVLSMRRDDKLFAGTIYLYANQELKKKGMTMVNQRPQAVFIFDTQTQEKVTYTQSPTLSVGVGYGGPGYYVGGVAPVAGGKITAVPYQEGTLIIEMFDVRTRQLVWRGWAQAALKNSSDLNHIIQWAARDIFAKLPVKPKK